MKLLLAFAFIFLALCRANTSGSSGIVAGAVSSLIPNKDGNKDELVQKINKSKRSFDFSKTSIGSSSEIKGDVQKKVDRIEQLIKDAANKEKEKLLAAANAKMAKPIQQIEKKIIEIIRTPAAPQLNKKIDEVKPEVAFSIFTKQDKDGKRYIYYLKSFYLLTFLPFYLFFLVSYYFFCMVSYLNDKN